MKLVDILAITNESTNFNVIDCNTQEVLSRYDGKNSIDTDYNECEVVTMYTENNEIFVEIIL